MNINNIIADAAKGAVLVIDVREANELRSSGQATGSLHIPLGLLALKADPKSPDFDPRLSTDKPVAVYCALGGRAGMATQTLQSLGYRAVNIGGFGDWAAAGGPVTKA